MLSFEDSQQLLAALRPALVVSGDDHHPCAHRHELPACPAGAGGWRAAGPAASAWEHTLATVSFLQVMPLRGSALCLSPRAARPALPGRGAARASGLGAAGAEDPRA